MSPITPLALISVAGLTNAFLGVVLWGVRRHLPFTIPGALPWSLAPLLCTGSTFFFGLERVLPASIVMLCGNALLMSGLGFFYFGSQLFLRQRCTWQAWALAGAALLAGLGVFWWIQPDFRARTVLFASAAAICSGAHAWLLLRHGRGFAARLMAQVLLVLCSVLVLRAATTFWHDAPDSTRTTQALMQQVYAVSLHLSALLLSIGSLLMISERVRYEFEYQATHDGLTGALTRRGIFQACEAEWARWQRYGRPFSVLLLDIDHFKRINDRWGHQAGDRVLQDCTRQIMARLRSTDVLGRYGGEEFVVLLQEADAEAAQAAAERIRQSLRLQAAIPGIPEYTASIGVATATAEDDCFDAMLKRADMGLYQAKASGRNQVVAL